MVKMLAARFLVVSSILVRTVKMGFAWNALSERWDGAVGELGEH